MKNFQLLKNQFIKNFQKNLCLLLMIFITAPMSLVFSQVQNDQVSYALYTRYGEFNQDGDGGCVGGNSPECHDEELVWKVAACPTDQNGRLAATGPDPETANCGTIFLCEKKVIDCRYGCTHNFFDRIMKKVGMQDGKYVIDWRSYDDDDSFDCIGGSNISNYSEYYGLFDVTDGLQFSDWRERDGFNLQGGLAWRDYWRYTHGQGPDDPLEFGIVENETLEHENSTEYDSRMAAENDEDLAYQDNWLATAGPDVTYTFQVGTEAQNVSVNMNIFRGGTNHKMLIYQDQTLLYEGTGTNKTFMDQLCPGTYTIVIESNKNLIQTLLGSYWDFGDTRDWFRLSVTASVITPSNPGTIMPLSTSACTNATIRDILDGGSGNITVVDGESPTFQWQKKELNGSWMDMINKTEPVLRNPGTMGNDPIQFRRLAMSCGVIGYSNELTITPEPGNIPNPGSIALSASSHDTIPLGTDPGMIDEVAPGSGSPSPISYLWQVCETNCNVTINWSDAPGNNNTNSYNIPVLNVSSNFRRVAINGCGAENISSEISITVVEPVGIIKGIVTSPLNAGGGSPVSGVNIEVVRTTPVPGGSLTTDTYNTLTNNNGTYSVSDIYFGGNKANFRVTPSKNDGIEHVFNPDDIIVVLEKGDPVEDLNADFIDETTFTVSGNIYQDFAGTQCGMDTVEIKLGSIVMDSTDAQGNYSFAVPGAGMYTIEPVFKDHSFNPSSFIGLIGANMMGLDFENTEINELSGFVGGSCDPIGQAQLTLTSEDLCINRMIDTDGNGQYNVTMPARPYRVQVTNFDNPGPYGELEVLAFFQNTVPVDLTEKDTMQDFIYRPLPTIEVSGFPADVCNRTILEQLVPVELTIKVWEGPTMCQVDTGYVLITDGISDRDNETIELPISNGEVIYEVVPGTPNLTAPYLKNLTIVARDTFDQSVTFTRDALVTGGRPRNSTFTTVTPEIPMMILHDPPGDASYAFLEQNQIMETTTSFYHQLGGSVNTWAAAKVGAKFTVGVGFAVENEVSAELSGGIEVSGSNTSSEEMTTSVEITEYFSTSGNADIIGAKGDVFIGGAMNLIYANTDIIDFNPATCSVISDVKLMIAPDGFETKYIYTQQHIEEFLIPDLLTLAENSSNPDSSLFFLDQANVWEQALLRNEELKASAIPSNPFQGNLSISAGVTHDLTVTSSRSSTLSWEYNVEVNTEVAFEAGIEAAGAGLSGGVTVGFRTDFGESESNTSSNSLTTGFHLEDDDPGDSYTVDILTDPVYQTPVFRVVAANSSCPYEEGTLQRDVPVLAVDLPVETDVDPASVAVFQLFLRNESEAGAERDYKLRFNQASNPDGAVITTGNWNDPFTIPFGGQIVQTLSVGKGPSAVFTYENLEFILFSECDPDIADTIAVSVFFDSPCSDLSMFEPNPNWVMNQNSNLMDVHLKDYDKALINTSDQIKIEYASTGSSSWQNATILTKSDLNNNNPGGSNLGDITSINLSNVIDGAYDIRVALVCGAGTIYSNRASGIIDRSSPALFGTPTPADDNYIQGQTPIEATFDQTIACNLVSVELINTTTNNTYTSQYQCSGNEMIFVPNQILPDGIYEITILDLKDISGNKSEPISWYFNVGEVSDDDCGPLVINNNDSGNVSIEEGGYYGTTIRSFGQVENLTDVEMIGEISIALEPDFEVQQGSEFLADIGDCDDAPDQNAPCHTAQPVTRGNIYNGNTNFGSIQGTGIACGPGDDTNYSNWYTLIGTNEVVTAYLCESAGWNVVIEVYTGSCGEELSCVTDNSSANTVAGCTVPAGEAIFMTQQDVTYYIRVRGEQAADQGRYALFIDACSSDLFSLKYYHCDQRLYVDYKATGTNDGSSWENAFVHLQDAITMHTSGTEIWVAKGTYYPDQGAGVTEGDATASFSDLSGSVEIYGGFNGTELPGFERDDRDIANNVTILSGDIGKKGDMSDNSFTVVHDCFINGVTVTKGNARGPAGSPTSYGGGYHLTSSKIIRECTFIDNHAKIGGGIYSEPSFLNEIWNCAFISNTAEKGGGAYIAFGGILSLYNCSFSGNVAIDTDSNAFDNGSALGISPNIFSVRIENSIFWGNGTAEDDDIKPQYYTENCIIELANDAIPFGINNLNEDPLFVDQPDLEDPSANLRLQAGSPAIDRLVGQTLFRIDIENNPRPQGNWDDIGAYEYVFQNN